jgi:hypothetical protein
LCRYERTTVRLQHRWSYSTVHRITVHRARFRREVQHVRPDRLLGSTPKAPIQCVLHGNDRLWAYADSVPYRLQAFRGQTVRSPRRRTPAHPHSLSRVSNMKGSIPIMFTLVSTLAHVARFENSMAISTACHGPAWSGRGWGRWRRFVPGPCPGAGAVAVANAGVGPSSESILDTGGGELGRRTVCFARGLVTALSARVMLTDGTIVTL